MLPDPLFLSVHMYGIMVAIGILCTFIVLYMYSKIKKVDEKFTDFVFYNGIASIVVGFISASVFQAFYDYIAELREYSTIAISQAPIEDKSYTEYIQEWLELRGPKPEFELDILGGSITFIGGLLGGILCFMILYFIFRRKYNTRLYEVVSIYPPCILIAHAFGRVGCFFAGCCYGKPTDSFLGVKFPGHSEAVHPTQLYEAFFLFLLFAVCSYLLLKMNFKHNLSLYLIAYGIFRFLIEYLRDDDRGELVGKISPSQFWSLGMVVAGIGMIFVIEYFFRKNKKEVNGR